MFGQSDSWSLEERTLAATDYGFKLEFDSTYSVALVIPLFAKDFTDFWQFVVPSTIAALVSLFIQLLLAIEVHVHILAPDSAPADGHCSVTDEGAFPSWPLRVACLFTMCVAILGGECREVLYMARWLRAFGWKVVGSSWWADYLDHLQRTGGSQDDERDRRAQLCDELQIEDCQLEEKIGIIKHHLDREHQKQKPENHRSKSDREPGREPGQKQKKTHKRGDAVLETAFVKELCRLVSNEHGLMFDVRKDGENSVYTPVTKMSIAYMLYAVVILCAKALTALYVLYLTSGHVAHARDHETLILNVVGVIFILDVDNFCFQLLVPYSVKQMLEDLPPIHCFDSTFPVVEELRLGRRYGTWFSLLAATFTTGMVYLGRCTTMFKLPFATLMASVFVFLWLPVTLSVTMLLIVVINRTWLWLQSSKRWRGWSKVETKRASAGSVRAQSSLSPQVDELHTSSDVLRELQSVNQHVLRLEREHAMQVAQLKSRIQELEKRCRQPDMSDFLETTNKPHAGLQMWHPLKPALEHIAVKAAPKASA